jgi:UDP-N-acetylmuramate dehydrogenase
MKHLARRVLKAEYRSQELEFRILSPAFCIYATFLAEAMMNQDAYPLIQENVLLAPYTTLGVGGPARFLVKAGSEEQIMSALEFARTRGCPVFVLGGGSNIVVSDSGFSGLVIKMELSGIQTPDEGSGTISVASGVGWDDFVQHCVSRNLAGIECLSGIPGTVGGAPVQNIGAYGEDVSEVLVQVKVLDRRTHRITHLSHADCQFAYRSSIFNATHRDRYIILQVDFALRKNGPPRIVYPDLRERFVDGAHAPAIDEVRKVVMQIRETKAMVVRDDDPDTRSAGSFFRNPVLTSEAVAEIEAKARMCRLLLSAERIPQFPAAQGRWKVPAAWFIEHAGFRKGYAHGNAGISGKHAMALTNRGGATAQEILELMRIIQDRVQMLFGIELQSEPEFVGFE